MGFLDIMSPTFLQRFVYLFVYLFIIWFWFWFLIPSNTGTRLPWRLRTNLTCHYVFPPGKMIVDNYVLSYNVLWEWLVTNLLSSTITMNVLLRHWSDVLSRLRGDYGRIGWSFASVFVLVLLTFTFTLHYIITIHISYLTFYSKPLLARLNNRLVCSCLSHWYARMHYYFILFYQIS